MVDIFNGRAICLEYAHEMFDNDGMITLLFEPKE
jgi:hypothetical protein